jgi:hypothetical protein
MKEAKKIAALEKQGAFDQIRIKALEKKVQELKEIDDLNRNLVELGNLVRRFFVSDPELMIANNLLKEIYKSEEDRKLVKIITCNKKYAAEIKDCVAKLSGSLGDTMDHLIKHKDCLRFKTEQEFQRSSTEIRRVLSTCRTGARSLSGIRLVVTSTGSTSSASTPKEAGESIQEKAKPSSGFLPKDI